MESALDIERGRELLGYLRQLGRIGPVEEPDIEVLTGGVSNRTVLIRRPTGEAWVIKQALPQLRVSTVWLSSPERIYREADALRWLERLTPPGSVPRLLFEDRARYILAMQAVPQPHTNWKTLLLKGEVVQEHVIQFGKLLGRIHRQGFEHRSALLPFLGDTRFFESLRIEPYYLFAAQQVPEAAAFLTALVAETRSLQLTLVHGDYSPKNVLIYDRKIVLLDHEVCHIGDPAFDVGFSLTHFLSKAHHLPTSRTAFVAAAQIYWETYRQELGTIPWAQELEDRVVRHTLACLLARVAGRSPLEYLTTEERIRQQRIALTLMGSERSRNVPELIHFFLKKVNDDDPYSTLGRPGDSR